MKRAQPCAEAAEALFDFRDQLLVDGVAIGAEVRRVHRIAVVVIGIGVLDLDHQEAREILAESISGRRRRPPAAGCGCSRRGGTARNSPASGSGSGGVVRKLVDVVREVAVEHHQRIVRVRMLVEPLRQQDVGRRDTSGRPQNFDSSSLLMRMCLTNAVSALGCDRRDLLVERERDRRRVWPRHARSPAWNRGCRASLPVLPLALVRRQLDHRAVGAVEGLVAVQHRLHEIVAGRQLRELLFGPAIGRCRPAPPTCRAPCRRPSGRT